MSSTTVSPPDVVSAALELIDAATDLLLSADVWRMPGQVQADALAAAERISRRFDYGVLRLLADFHSRDIAGEQAGVSTRQFLRSRLRISSGEAARRIHAARELVPGTLPSGETVEPELPTTAAGVAVRRVVGRACADHQCRDPETPDRTGLHHPHPKLKRPWRPMPESWSPPISRPWPGDCIYTSMRTARCPDDKPSRRELSFRRDIDGTDVIRGRLDPEASATVQAALAPLMQRRPAEDGVRDPRSPARRRADALVQLSEQALNRGDLPTVAGEKPHVTVTISLDELRSGTGHATLNTGTAISVEAARRIACDASVIPMVLGSQGEPLDIGRASRIIPPGIRRAVVARDVGCVHPACDQPASQLPDPPHQPLGQRRPQPQSTTSYSSAPNTTGPSTTTNGESSSYKANHTSSHHHSSTRPNDPDETPHTTHPTARGNDPPTSSTTRQVSAASGQCGQGCAW